MQKILEIIRLIIELINGFRGKPTDVSDQNVKAVRTGLDLSPEEDPEVANAKHRLEQIAKLPENKRKHRASEIKEMENLVKDKIVVPVPNNKKNLLDEIREAEGKNNEE